MLVDKDAFSSGQIGSKIWLSEHLEECVLDLHFQGLFTQPLKIVTIGGWYGLLSFILQTRKILNVDYIRSIDIDQKACDTADLLNEFWLWQNWKFKALCRDANDFEYFDFDIIINSSVEHIPTRLWWENIPEGKIVVLQSNDMQHDDHICNHTSLEDFDKDFNFSNTLFLGSKSFQYETWSFTRFMKIGIK